MSDRDFTSVSKTAKLMVMLKSITDIPYAKQTTKLVHGYEVSEKTIDPQHITHFYQGSIAFEARYLSIDRVLAKTEVRNFLELSSGYSFRSLVLGTQQGIVYIDTDLPDIIEHKKEMAKQLIGANNPGPNQPRFFPLNALDETAFLEIVSLFPPGPVAIVNEGLLIYLNDDEKRRLSQIIHQVLTDRGGFWITGDIYVRGAHSAAAASHLTQQAQEFLTKHRVLENMLSSFEAAAEFFKECGFSIETHSVDEIYEELSCLRFIRKLPAMDESDARISLQARQTWVLTAI